MERYRIGGTDRKDRPVRLKPIHPMDLATRGNLETLLRLLKDHEIVLEAEHS